VNFSGVCRLRALGLAGHGAWRGPQRQATLLHHQQQAASSSFRLVLPAVAPASPGRRTEYWNGRGDRALRQRRCTRRLFRRRGHIQTSASNRAGIPEMTPAMAHAYRQIKPIHTRSINRGLLADRAQKKAPVSRDKCTPQRMSQVRPIRPSTSSGTMRAGLRSLGRARLP
jgi:hypothetical protein